MRLENRKVIITGGAQGMGGRSPEPWRARVKAEKRGWTYEQVYDEYLDEMALRRVTTPQDVANSVVFLASDDSQNITGQEIVVCGGWAV